MKNNRLDGHYVVCIDNSAYPTSLELHKVYEALPDPKGERVGLIRLVDETGDDYLYPSALFAPVELPEEAKASFRLISTRLSS